MAITSVGYDGTVDEIQFEKIMGYSAHSKYGVNTSGAFAASTVAGQVLQVKIKGNQGTFPAAAWTAGVVDLMDTDETVQIEPATSGSRWDLIALRRDYQPPGGETALTVVKGTGRKTIPSRETNAGVLDDQPLWLVRVDAGKSTVSEYVDLRVWARNGGCTARHDLVRSYMGITGTQIEINGTLWLRRVGKSGDEEWVKPIDLADGPIDNSRLQNISGGDSWLAVSSGDAAMRLAAVGSFYTQFKGETKFQVGPDGLMRSRGKESAYNRTYSGRPNMYVSSNGYIGRSTASSSLRRYKANIQAADINVADVLALEPVTYDRRDGSMQGELGLIADDTEPLVPQLVFHEAGQLEGINYDRLAVAQQIVIRQHEARIHKLEKTLQTAMEAIAELKQNRA